MVKKLFKSLSVGLIVFMAAILCGYISYVITLRYQTELLSDIAKKDNVSAAANMSTLPLSESEPILVDYYIARLEDNKLSIYISSNQKEAFLYSLDIYEADFPKEDIERLRNGVILKTKQDLTSFEEDFTS